MRILSGSAPIGARVAVERASRHTADAGSPERVGKAMEPTAHPHERAPVEPLQRERGEIELTLRFRVGGEEHLEATVELEAVDHVRAHAPTDAVGCLEDDHVAAGLVQCSRAGESGQAGSDHGDVYAFGLVGGVSHVRRACSAEHPRARDG